MLRIRDNVDLKKLKKYGFEEAKPMDYKYPYFLKINSDEYILVQNRELWYYVEDELYGYADPKAFDVIYNLTKADLLEEVGDKYE